MALLSDLASPSLGLLGADQGMTANPGALSALAAIQPRVKPNFFGQGDTGRSIAGYIGDALLQLGGGHAMFGPAMQQREENERQLAMLREREGRPQAINLGDGGVATYSPTGGLTVLREPTVDVPKPTPLQQQVEYVHSLDPNLSPAQLAEIAKRGIAGYGFSDEARAGKVADATSIAAARGAEARTTKAMPTYAALHPKSNGGGVTPTARAKAIGDAEAAISKGASRAAVYARLAKMGIQ